MAGPPESLEALKAQIVARHETLSPRLKQVAAYVLDHPTDMGLETLAVIAARCRVQPSTIVRFAKAFGYGGASQMQRLFREELISLAPSPSYAERVRQFNARDGEPGRLSPGRLMHEFADSNILALEHLKEAVPEDTLTRAVDDLEAAESVYIVGLRRSFPVAAYLAYALRHVEKPCHLIDGMAGMFVEQSSMMSARDLLIAISFHPYATETAEIVSRARPLGTRVLALSDTLLSPIARDADVSFAVKDAEVRQFRSLTASLCLAQTLVIGYAYRLEAKARGAAAEQTP